MANVVCMAGQGLSQKNRIDLETFPLICQANSTEVRAAAEAEAGVQQVPAPVLEAHCAHSAFVGQSTTGPTGAKSSM